MYDEYEVNDYMQNFPELTIVPTRSLERQEVGTLIIAERAELSRQLVDWEYTSEGNLQRIWSGSLMTLQPPLVGLTESDPYVAKELVTAPNSA